MSDEAWWVVVAIEVALLFALEWRVGFYGTLVLDIAGAVWEWLSRRGA